MAPGRTQHLDAHADRRGATFADPQLSEADYPTLADGVRGVRFIEKTVESAASAQKWTRMA